MAETHKNTDAEDKQSNSNYEYQGYILLKTYLQDSFEVQKMCEGCLADCAIRLKNDTSDEWVAIQMKSSKSNRFKITKKYTDCFVICINIIEELFWIFDGNNCTGFIAAANPKFDSYSVTKENLIEYFKSNYFNYNRRPIDTLNIPISFYHQREQIFRKKREENVDLDFQYPEEEGLVYDFIVSNKKFQEKVGGYKPKNKTAICFGLYKNAGVNKNNHTRQFQAYNLGDNDYYWLNHYDSDVFYVIPEHVLEFTGHVKEQKTIGQVRLSLPPNSSNHWTELYMFSYSEVDIQKLKQLIENPYEFDDLFKEKVNISVKTVRVAQYDENDNLIAEYNSLTEASIKTGIHYTVIGKVCDPTLIHYKTAGGFKWKYLDNFEKPKRVSTKHSEEAKERMREAAKKNFKKVVQMDLEGNTLRVFENADEAAEFVGVKKHTLTAVCRGARATSAGFKWKYEKL